MVIKSHVGIQSTGIKDGQHLESVRWDCTVRLPCPIPVDSYGSALIFFPMCGRQASVSTSNYCCNTLQQTWEFKATGCYSFTFLEIRHLNQGVKRMGSLWRAQEKKFIFFSFKKAPTFHDSWPLPQTVPAYPFYWHILLTANQQPWLSNLFVLMFSI